MDQVKAKPNKTRDSEQGNDYAVADQILVTKTTSQYVERRTEYQKIYPREMHEHYESFDVGNYRIKTNRYPAQHIPGRINSQNRDTAASGAGSS